MDVVGFKKTMIFKSPKPKKEIPPPDNGHAMWHGGTHAGVCVLGVSGGTGGLENGRVAVCLGAKP